MKSSLMVPGPRGMVRGWKSKMVSVLKELEQAELLSFDRATFGELWEFRRGERNPERLGGKGGTRKGSYSWRE